MLKIPKNNSEEKYKYYFVCNMQIMKITFFPLNKIIIVNKFKISV